MSWVQWRGEIWPASAGQGHLSLRLQTPNASGPRQSWQFRHDHVLREPATEPGPADYYRCLGVDISELHFCEPDWRRFSGREIHATPAWQDAHETIDDFGHLTRAEITVHIHGHHPAREDRAEYLEYSTWIGEDFLIRFGTRDGYCFPCELDAWLVPEEQYFRSQPETAEEVARSAQGTPTLRLITSACFRESWVQMLRAGDDPRPAARHHLFAETGCDHLEAHHIAWALRHTPGSQDLSRMPGWTSTVHFAPPRVKFAPP